MYEVLAWLHFLRYWALWVSESQLQILQQFDRKMHFLLHGL